MSIIDIKNASRIRDPMDVFCGLSARMSADLTFQLSGSIKARDSNVNTALDNENWDMRTMTDLQGSGFPLDGSCTLYNETLAGSLADGKVGVRTAVGGSFTVAVSSATNIPAVTIAVKNGSEGTGTVTANGVTYEIRRITVVPVNAKNVTLIFASTDPDRRLEIASITPGISMTFDKNSLISVEASLRSNLAIADPTWEISDIEIRAYWPDDISEAISNINDDVPIWYYAGYPGDYSPVRNFYLSEPASMTRNIITLKGEDASHKLEKKNNIAQVLNSTAGTGRRDLYNRFVKFITDSGIRLVQKENAPGTTSGSTAYTLVWDENTSREIVSHIMNLTHNGSYWPTFVDAGIPRVYWSKPAKKWDIYEDECGDVTRVVERNIAKITAAGDYGLHPTAARKNAVQTLQARNVEAGKGYSLSPDGYWWYLTVSNASSQLATASKIVWTAKKTTTTKKVKVNTGKKYTSGKNKGKWIYKEETRTYDQCVVKGKGVTIGNTGVKSIMPDDKRPGTAVEMQTLGVGRVYGGTTLIYPYYKYLFARSNITGSFKWKGDPRMQPRDVFYFHRLDGTVETCTIESIVLTHEAGGLISEITYRKGIC